MCKLIMQELHTYASLKTFAERPGQRYKFNTNAQMVTPDDFAGHAFFCLEVQHYEAVRHSAGGYFNHCAIAGNVVDEAADYLIAKVDLRKVIHRSAAFGTLFSAGVEQLFVVVWIGGNIAGHGNLVKRYSARNFAILSRLGSALVNLKTARKDTTGLSTGGINR